MSGDLEISQVPGRSLTTCPGLRPRRTKELSPLTSPFVLPSVPIDTSAPQPISFEALFRSLPSPCVRFAARVTPRPRNTRFWLVAYLYQVRTCTCWIALEGFFHGLHVSPFSKLGLAQYREYVVGAGFVSRGRKPPMPFGWVEFSSQAPSLHRRGLYRPW